MFRPVFAALLLFFAVSVAGLSGTIWNNGPPNGVDEWTINDSIVEADDFVLAAPTRITRINFSAASDVNTAVIALNYSLYSSTAGLPATLVEQGAAQNLVATPAGMVACCGSFRFATSFDITPVSLRAGSYWLALYDASNGTSFRVYWDTTADLLDTSGFAQAFEPNFAFTVIGVSGPFGRDLSFSLQDVPEPSTTILSFVGIVLTGALWRAVAIQHAVL